QDDEDLSEHEKRENQIKNKYKTISNVLERLKVFKKPNSLTIYLQFTSESPQKAQEIANVIAEEYLFNQLAIKFDATKKANSWLNSKLADLQKNLHESDILVQAFRKKHGLVQSEGVTISDKQLSEISSQLILAKAETAQAEARLKFSKESIQESVEVLNSPLIQTLRGQETEVVRKKSDLEARYGNKHPKIVNVNAELRDLRQKIDQEINKIRNSLKHEVRIAKTREMELKKSLQQMQNKSGVSGAARVQLDELVRQNNANRSLYESFLARYKETSIDQDMEQADARIVSYAEAPIKPSAPKKRIIFLLFTFFGVLFGISLSFVIYFMNNTIKSASQLEQLIGRSVIGIIPELSYGALFSKYICEHPSSMFSEAIRAVWTAIHYSNPDKEARTIMVTSSLPEEGKTSFSSSLATLISKSGKKAIIIDCDLKRPSISKCFEKVDNKFVLNDLLTGDAPLSKVVNHDKKTGVDFILASPNTHNSNEILGSKKMQDLLILLGSKYDFIILDTPPVIAVSDCLVVSKFVDGKNLQKKLLKLL
ncbi:AAA family ATPase, partial [Rickettsiales bacterium]|nr:AAA family ATPase [Rickettsiales bacterium]